MLVGVNTKKMEISVEDDKIGVLVDYELDVNHEPLADCKIKMSIMPKQKRSNPADLKGERSETDG